MKPENYKDIRRHVEETNSVPDLTSEEEYQFYLDHALRTKKDLLAEIEKARQSVQNGSHISNIDHLSPVFLEKIDDLFFSFYNTVKEKLLPDPLDNWWSYHFEATEKEITLILAHNVLWYTELYSTDKRHRLVADEEYVIIDEKAPLLSLDEFGAQYDVNGTTARQWIRRGKLKCAVKFGNDWRIPSTAVLTTQKHYKNGNYTLNHDVEDPPEEIPDINNYSDIAISPAPYKPGTWQVFLIPNYRSNAKERVQLLDVNAKERLELYLISNPNVTCNNINVITVRQKD